MELPVLIGVAVGVVTLLLLLGGVFKAAPKKFLDKTRQKVKLAKVDELSHDTLRLRFALPTPKHTLGLPVGKHFKVFCPNAKGVKAGEWNGRKDEETESEIERKYTPTTSDDELGYVDLVIKVYQRGVVDRFPDGGKMSQHMGSLKVGDTLDISGPWGMIEYAGRGKFMYGKKEIMTTHLGMMAGGTGITPMLQLIAAILKDPKDQTKLSLIFANQTEADILVREDLEALQKQHPTRFKLHYTVDRPSAGWRYSSGFITAEMITEHLPAPSPKTLIVMCGPPPMVQYACKANLDKLGYDKKLQLAF